METYGIEKYGIIGPKAVYRNLTPAQLVEAALRRGEGSLSNTGALVVTTGKYTGRSPNDKFIVDTEGVHNEIAWGKVNRPISREKFDAIKGKVAAYLQGREIFIFDGYAGADPRHTKKFRIINELASQNLFIHQLLIRPTAEQLAGYGEPDYTMLVAPGFKCDHHDRLRGPHDRHRRQPVQRRDQEERLLHHELRHDQGERPAHALLGQHGSRDP